MWFQGAWPTTAANPYAFPLPCYLPWNKNVLFFELQIWFFQFWIKKKENMHCVNYPTFLIIKIQSQAKQRNREPYFISVVIVHILVFIDSIRHWQQWFFIRWQQVFPFCTIAQIINQALVEKNNLKRQSIVVIDQQQKEGGGGGQHTSLIINFLGNE